MFRMSAHGQKRTLRFGRGRDYCDIRHAAVRLGILWRVCYWDASVQFFIFLLQVTEVVTCVLSSASLVSEIGKALN